MHRSTATAATHGSRSDAVADAREYLTFRLGSEEYGIDILKAQEIRSYEAVTRIANAPPFIKGVVNLRGLIVPIIDMRIRFGVSAPRYDAFTVVIVLNVGDRVVGMVVDAVSDVVALEADQLHAAPEFASDLRTGFITSLATIDSRMLILIDIEKLMLAPDMGLVDPVVH